MQLLQGNITFTANIGVVYLGDEVADRWFEWVLIWEHDINLEYAMLVWRFLRPDESGPPVH